MRPSRVVPTVGLAAALLASSPSGQSILVAHGVPETAAVSGDWPQPAFDATSSSFNPAETAVGAVQVPRLKVKWTYSLGADVFQSDPVVAGGRLYLTAQTNNPRVNYLIGVDTTKGITLFKSSIGPCPSSPVFDDGRIFLTTHDDTSCFASVSRPKDTLSAFSASSGARLWSVANTAFVGWQPVVADHLIIQDDHNLTARSEQSGRIVWSTPPPEGSGQWHASSGVDRGGGIVLVNGTLVVGSESSTAASWHNSGVAVSTGKIKWSIPDSSGPEAGRSAANVVIESNPNAAGLLALDVSTGAVRWTSSSTEAIIDLPIGPNALFANSRNSGQSLLALSPTTGKRLWAVPSATLSWPSVAADGVVYVLSNGGVQAYSTTSGKPIGQSLLPTTGPRGVVVSHGTVYIYNYSRIFALAPA